jgi:hypothetical protein
VLVTLAAAVVLEVDAVVEGDVAVGAVLEQISRIPFRT